MKTENNQLVHLELGKVHKHLRRAVERLSADITDDPGDTNARIMRAVAYRVLGEFELAMQDYDHLAVACPLDPTVPHSRGITLLSQGELATAAKAFDQANELDPWDVESYYRRVATRLALGETRAAIEVFDEFIGSYPQDAFEPGEWESIQRERQLRGA